MTSMTSVIQDLRASTQGTTTRSLLMTVFGDALLPRDQPTSVVDLALLVAPLGVNERAVRTTLLRLGRDDLVDAQKVGRRSLYAVAASARDTFERADQRIYEDTDVAWDGHWTLAIVDPTPDAADRTRLQRELRWAGMATLQTGVLASPTIDPQIVAALAKQHRVPLTALLRSPLMSGSLDGDPQLAAFTDPSGRLHELHEKHMERWAPIVAKDVPDEHSFATRVLLLDNWRRIALQTLAAPRELLPDTWLGDTARTITSELYDGLFAASEAFLDAQLGPAKSNRNGFSPLTSD